METLCKSESPSPQAPKELLLLLNPLKVKAAQGSGGGRRVPSKDLWGESGQSWGKRGDFSFNTNKEALSPLGEPKMMPSGQESEFGPSAISQMARARLRAHCWARHQQKGGQCGNTGPRVMSGETEIRGGQVITLSNQ